MQDLFVPNFGELLGPYIKSVPDHAKPNFLALLERGAAQRYRYWAKQLPTHQEGLNQCADREDQIADIIESLFPIDKDLAEMIKAPLPSAQEEYYGVFQQLSLPDQLEVQADAELQGAEAWRAMLNDELATGTRDGLERCISLEQTSSKYLYSILPSVRASH